MTANKKTHTKKKRKRSQTHTNFFFLLSKVWEPYSNSHTSAHPNKHCTMSSRNNSTKVAKNKNETTNMNHCSLNVFIFRQTNHFLLTFHTHTHTHTHNGTKSQKKKPKTKQSINNIKIQTNTKKTQKTKTKNTK